MKSATPVSKEAIKLLVIQHGQREAARIAGLNENTVRSWAMRYKWPATNPQPKQGNTQLIDKIQTELEQNGRQTKLSLSRYTARAAKDAEKASLRDSGHVLNVAKTHQVLFPPQQQQNQILNLAILTNQDPPVRTIDAEVIEDSL